MITSRLGLPAQLHADFRHQQLKASLPAVPDTHRQETALPLRPGELGRTREIQPAEEKVFHSDVGAVCRDPAAELLGRHFQAENCHPRLAHGLFRCRAGFHSLIVLPLRDPLPDLDGKRRLSGAREASQQSHIFRQEPPDCLVHRRQAAQHRRRCAPRVDKLRLRYGSAHGVSQRHRSVPTPAAHPQVGNRPLCRLDLLGGTEPRISPIGPVSNGLTDLDQLAPHPCVVHCMGVFDRVRDAHHGAEQLSQIGRAADLPQKAGLLEIGFQADCISPVTIQDALRYAPVDQLMAGIREVLRQ